MKSTQSDKGLGFDGAEQVSRRDTSKKFAGNQSGLTGTVNAGRGPTRGNNGACHDPISGAGSAKGAPDTSGKSSKVADSDSINVGRGPTGGGRKFAPSAGQNYHGNADRINVGRGPTKGNQQ